MPQAVTEKQLKEALDAQATLFRELIDLQQKNFMTCIESFIKATKKRFDTLIAKRATKFSDLRKTWEFSQQDIDETKKYCSR